MKLSMQPNDSTALIFVSDTGLMWGAETSLLTLAQHIDPAVRVGLVCRSDMLRRAWPRQVGVRGEASNSSLTPAVVLAATESIRIELGVERVILVVFNLSVLSTAILVRLRSPSCKAVVLDLHDRLPTFTGRWKLKAAAALCNRVIPITHYVAQQVLPFNVTPPLTRPVQAPEKRARRAQARTRVGVVGRIDPDKNLEFVVEVARSRPDLEFHLIGLPSPGAEVYADEIRRASESLENVRWRGRLDTKELYDEFDVLLSVNGAEAMGRTLIESQLNGLAAVGPDSGGTKEVLARTGAGYVYRHGSVRSASSAIDLAARTSDQTLNLSRQYWVVNADPDVYARTYVAAAMGEI